MSIHDRDWYWQDRARKERQYYNPREFRSQGAGTATYGSSASAPSRRPSAVSANIVAAIVVVLVSLLLMVLSQWRAETAAKEFMRSSQAAAARVQAQALQAQQEAGERQVRRQAEFERQEVLRSQAIAERQGAENERKRAGIAEADRKERAWAKFYRKPGVCNDAATVECANSYIRAKRTFEDKYARGNL